MAAKLKALQQWCRRQCDGYRDVTITNMTSSWKSGLAFCAIIHRYHPNLINYDSLSKENVYENNKLAFEVAKGLGIPALLDAEDMVAMEVPDKLCIITYVAQYYAYFHNKTPAAAVTVEHKRRKSSAQLKTQDLKGLRSSVVKHSVKELKALRSPTSKYLNIPTDAVSQLDVSLISSHSSISSQADGHDNDDAATPPPSSYNSRRRGSVVDDVCHACSGRVYVLERHLSASGQLYHRRCFRRDSVSTLRRRSVSKENKENSLPPDDLSATSTPSDGSSMNEYSSKLTEASVAEVIKGDASVGVGLSGLHSGTDLSAGVRNNGTGGRPMSVVLEDHSPAKVAATAGSVTSASTNGFQVVTPSRALPDSSSAAAAAVTIGSMIKSKLITNGCSATGRSDKTNTDYVMPSLSNETPLISEIETCSASGNTPVVGRIQSRDLSPQPTRTDYNNVFTGVNSTPNTTKTIYSGHLASYSSTNTIAFSSAPPSTVHNGATYSQTGVSMRARPAVPQGLQASDPFRRFTYCSSDESHPLDNSQGKSFAAPSSAKPTKLSATPVPVCKETEHSLQDQMSSTTETRSPLKASRPAQSTSSAAGMKTAYSVDNISSVCIPRPLKAVTSVPLTEVMTINPTSKLLLSNRHSAYVPLSTSTTVTPSRQSTHETPLQVSAKQPPTTDAITAASSPSSVLELRRHQARNVLTNAVSEALFGKRQSAPLNMTREELQQVPATHEENGPSSKMRTGVVTVASGNEVGKLPEAETRRAATIIASSLSAARPVSWASPNRVENLIDRKSSRSQLTSVQKTPLTSSQSTDENSRGGINALTTVTHPLGPNPNTHEVSHQQNNEKFDWQVEAERRRVTRNGNYVDPANVSPAAVPAVVRRGILKGASSMENILSSKDKQLEDHTVKSETSTSVESSPFQKISSSVPEDVVVSGVVMRGHAELKMTDRGVDVVQPASRHSIYIDPAKQRTPSKRSQLSASSSVDNLSMLSDKSFGLSPCHISDNNVDEHERSDDITGSKKITGSFAVTNRSLSATSDTTQTELKSTDYHLEVRRVTSDQQRPHTIIVDSKQFSKKLSDSAARLAASMDDLSTPSSADNKAVPQPVGTGSAECQMKRCTDAFASADDILCSSSKSSAASKKTGSSQPVSRVPAFKIADSGDDDEKKTVVKPATNLAGRTKVIVGSEISIQIRIPQLTGNDRSAVNGSGVSDGSWSTCGILVEPATPTDAVVNSNESCDRLDELDIQLNEVEMSGRMLEERIRGTGDSMADDDGEAMAQWYALVKRRNELVREESMMIYKRQQLDLEERQCEIQFELKNIGRKPAHLRTPVDKQAEEKLLKELSDTLAQKNAIVESMENDRKRYLQEDEQLDAMLAIPELTNHRRGGNVLVGIRSSIRRRKSMSKAASPGYGKNKTKNRLSSFFFGKKSSSSQKKVSKLEAKVAEQ